jgi:hypothetical protein
MRKPFCAALALTALVWVVPDEVEIDKLLSLPSAGIKIGEGGVSGPVVPPSVYDDAVGIWTFNDINGLGLEGNDSFDGYAADMEASSSQYAVTGSDLTRAASTSFTVAGWYKRESSGVMALAGQDFSGGNRNWGFLSAGSAITLNVWDTDNTLDINEAVGSGCDTAGTRSHLAFVYDQSTRKVTVYCDGTGYTSTGTLANGVRAVDMPLYVADRYAASAEYDGVVGPVAFWAGEALSQSDIDDLYNSGKGTTCADLPAGAEHCWDMDEASGDYIDSVGANDLTPVNSPTQTTGLIISGDGDPDLYLTEVNTPTGTGGALGYSTELLDTSSQYATVAAITAKSTDRSVCAWWDQHSLLGDAFLGVGNAPVEFTPVWYLSVHVSNKIQLYQSGAAAVGTVTISSDRNFICYTYDHSASGAQVVYVNGVSDITKSALDNGGHNATNFYVGVGFAGYWKGQIGPVVYYDAPIAQAEVTSMYNSGKGKTCADLSGDELTDLVSCWEMEEDGGPYVDSIGSSDLTAVNTPTRAAGLVERSDSGMSVEFVGASSQALRMNQTAAASSWSGEISAAGWVWRDGTTGHEGFFINGGSSSSDTHFDCGLDGGVGSAFFARGGSDDGNVQTKGIGFAPHTTWDFVACGIDSSKNVWLSVNGAAKQNSPAPLTGNVDWTFDALKWMGVHLLNTTAGSSGNADQQFDNVAYWFRDITQDEIDELYASGAGDFYSAYWDVIFEGPRFAWSAPPERRRIYAVH